MDRLAFPRGATWLLVSVLVVAVFNGMAARAGAALSKPTYATGRSEEHTSELQSHSDLVCRLLLEKKNERDLRARLELTLVRMEHDGASVVTVSAAKDELKD